MLKIQEFLRASNPRSAIRKAVEKWNLKVSESEDLVQLNYHMIDSPRGVQEVDECRGLILKKPSWDIVAYPFYRFYNEHEGHAATVKSRNATLVEKLDGSLITLYRHKGTWRVATRGTVDASGCVCKIIEGQVQSDDRMKFSELFWEIASHQFKPGLDGPGAEFPEFCMVFELTSPENRVVTPYNERKLSLLMARNMDSWTELPPSGLDALAEEIGANRPRVFEFKDKNHIRNMLQMIPQLEEGFVLVDYSQLVNGSYKRVKIKNPRYLAVSKVIDRGFNHEKAFEMILTDDSEEFLSYFPEYKEMVWETQVCINNAKEKVEKAFSNSKDLPSRKEFAIANKDIPFQGLMFAMMDNGWEFLEAMRNAIFMKNGLISDKKVKDAWINIKKMNAID